MHCIHDESPEDHALAFDPISGRLVCVAHPVVPVPREPEFAHGEHTIPTPICKGATCLSST